MAFNINQYLDEIKQNIDDINSKYGSDIDTMNNTILNELKNDYSNLQNAIKKPNNTYAAYNLIAVITYKLDSIQGILIGLEITKQTAVTTELANDISNANDALKKAQEELKKQIDDKAAAEKAAAELENEINSLTANATTQEQTIADFKDTLTKNELELKKLQDELYKTGNTATTSQLQLNEYKEKEAQLLKEKENIESKITSYNEFIATNETELQNKKEELKTLTATILEANAMVDEKKQELIEKQAETELLTQEIKKVTEENDKLKEDLKQKQVEYSELIEKTVALGVNIADLNGQITAAELLKQENEKNKLAAENELDKINKEKEQAVNDLTEINKQKDEAQAKLKELQDEITNLEAKKTRIENGIKNLEEKKYKLIEQRKELEQQNITLNSKNELLKGQITEFDTQIAELQKELDNKNTDLENVNNSISEKKSENTNLSETNANLEKQIAIGKQIYEAGVINAMNTIKEYNDIITDLQAQTEELEKEKEILTTELQENKQKITISKNVIGALTQQQQELQTTNEALKKQQEELEESNTEANRALFNTLGAIQTNQETIADQLTLIGEQEQTIIKQKQKMKELNNEIDGLNQSRDSLIAISDAKSEELIAAQEKINEIQENLTAKHNELASKKKEMEDIEVREKTLSENEAKLSQRTEELEERAKIQADKETLQAEIERLNAENNALQEDNQSISETIDRDETLIRELHEKVKNYEELLKEKQDEFERSISELEQQQIIEDKQKFVLLLDTVDALKGQYETNKATTSIRKTIGSFLLDVDDGRKEYIDSIGILIDLSKNNKYFNYLTTSIGLDSQEDVDNINRYREYEDIYKNPPQKIPSPPAQEEQTTDELPPPPPPFEPKPLNNVLKSQDIEKTNVNSSNSQNPPLPPPPTPLEEIYENIQSINTKKKLSEENKTFLLQQCILYLDLYIQQHQLHTINARDKIQYLTSDQVLQKGTLVASKNKKWHNGIFISKDGEKYIIRYYKGIDNNLSEDIIVTDRTKLRFEPQFHITDIENILKYNDDACKDKTIKQIYLDSNKKITNYLQTLESYTDEKLNYVKTYINTEIHARYKKCRDTHSGGSKKTKRNQKYNKKTRRNHKYTSEY